MTIAQKTHTELAVPGIGSITIPVGLFIDNEWVLPANGETFGTVNPATGKPLVDVAHASAEDVDRAVKSAREAFHTRWGLRVTGAERGRLLNRLADLIERDAKTIAALESLNAGKGISKATNGDVAGTVSTLRYYAGLADKFYGQTINQFGPDAIAYTLHQPIGVCGQIIPWNYPLMMWSWKVAPALAAGCTIVMKPSELTPLTALYMCDLVKEAGIPAGVINTVPGLGATTGEAISRHMDIDKVAFTGSVATGRRISVAAAESNLKKVTLELGGKSPSLVFPSADLEQAAAWTAMGIFWNSGQDCCASSRIYVHESVYDEFVRLLKAKAETCAIGQPSDPATSFGPLISAGQRDKVLSYIHSARDEGANIITGGDNWGTDGFWVQPTVIGDVHQGMKVVREEIFGPVTAVGVFKTEEEAVKLANDTSYGLAGAVFSNDASQVARVTGAIDAGTIWVNQYSSVSAGVPFGGFKQSGIGRELGTYGIEAYTQVKAVHQNIGQKMGWPF
ncbi:Aldehyde dehydrogenase [Vanrija pseudolonga]|uniref:Aldehyde dehydrogenase n=1 Tax=Vanrija pseudolonga TaxID=143232 RepID=A0AAF0Y8F9_9TREE|nr:Aldehyde dehydrogenase [Vanrija pseudolonga]